MLKKLTLAITAALVSTSVMATLPSVTPGIEIFMSGATAQDLAIESLMTDLCVANTLDTFKQGTSHAAYYCNIDSSKIINGTTIVNPTVLFHKRSAGGSALGVNPEIDGTAIEHMRIIRANGTNNCTESSLGSKSWACTAVAANGDTLMVASDVGVSDVNPELFVGENTPTGSSPVEALLAATNLDRKSVV